MPELGRACLDRCRNTLDECDDLDCKFEYLEQIKNEME